MNGVLELATLGDLVTLRTEKIVANKDPRLPYVGLEHIAQGSPRLLGLAKSGSSSSTNSAFTKDDILFGKLRPNLRKSIRARFPGYCSTDILVLRCLEGVAPSFAGHVFQWEQVFAAGSATAVGTKMPRTSWNELKRFAVFKPSTSAEQSRIAKVLDTVDETIAKTEAMIAKLKQVRTGLLHDLLTRGLDEHGQLRDPVRQPNQFQDSPLGLIPREWVLNTIDRTVAQPADLTIGPFGSNLLASDYRPEGVPVVFVRDIRENEFQWNSGVYIAQDKAHELRSHAVWTGDVLITKMGLPPCIAAVYLDWMPNGIVTADVIRLRPSASVTSSFWLAAYINSPRFAACVRQITGGVTRPKVTLADFRKQPVLLPSTEEQARIRTTLKASDSVIDKAQAESLKLQKLKSGLMTDLLTGRVRVPTRVI